MKRLVPLIAVGVAIVGVAAFSQQSGDGTGLLGGQSDAATTQKLDSLVNGSLSGRRVTPAAEVTLGTLYIEGAGRASQTVVGNGGWVVLAAGYSTRSAGEVPDLQLSLERQSAGGSWEATAAEVERAATGTLQVRTPEWSTDDATADVQYRLTSAAFDDGAGHAVAATSSTSTVTLRYENQRFYTGLASTIYQAAATYCPSTAVHIADLPDGKAGLFETGSQLIQVDPVVGDTARYGPLGVPAVALHECSHERQFLNYGATSDGRIRMDAAAAAVFADFEKPAGELTLYAYHEPDGGTIDPIEHAADCGAQSVNPGGYLGYGGWCSDAQLDAGERLLRGDMY